MKKNLFFSILLLVTKVYTQTVPANEVSLDQMLVNIDKTTVISGVIYERVAPYTNLYSFNTNVNRNIADFEFFKQALLEMYLASNQSQFSSIETLNNNLNPIVYNDASVTMGILNTPFQSINYNEENPSLGRLQYDATNYLFYASVNTSLPLFNSSFATVISPLKDVVKGDYISFNWATPFIFENTLNNTKRIKNLTVNYGNGTVYTVISNYIIASATQQINYPDTGEKQITFTITYSDNSSLTTYAKIKYLKVITNPSYRIMGSDPNCGSEYKLREHNKEIVSDYQFQGYDEPFAFKGFINWDVFYRTTATEKKLLKPIIIIDGFDPGDKRKVLPCDYEPLQYKVGESRAISEIMKYGVNKDKDLIKELQNKGYDVVIVNQPTYYIMNTPPYQIVPIGTSGSKEIDGGGDYIERNGLNLVTLIKKINAELITNGSTEKLVIVGPSMGGQISRYALAYMEKNNIPHNTRLWVSVDSPHLGANIPLGTQAEISLLKDGNDEARNFYDKQLGSVAAKQQLIEFHKEIVEYINLGNLRIPLRKVDESLLNARTISQGFSTNSGSSFFQNFYNNQFSNGLPNSKGYPMNLRKIALVNGSLLGAKTGSDSQQTMNIRGFADVCFIFCFKVHAASMEVYTLPIFGNTSKIARYKKGFTDQSIAAPNINSRGNMDIIPGGVFNSYDQLHNSIMGKSGTEMNSASFYIDINPKDIHLESRTNTMIHSFIPTFSALGIKNSNQDWGQSLNRNLVCSGETPFDSFYGETINTEHTSFNENSVAWLFKELGDSTRPPIAQTPIYPLQKGLLGGSNNICLNTSTIYQLDPCKVPSSATWSVTPNLQIVSSNGYSITFKGISNGTATITATFQNGQIISKTIWVGLPSIVSLTSYSGIPFTVAVTPYPAGCGFGSRTYWTFKSNFNDYTNQYVFRINNEIVVTKSTTNGSVNVYADELGVGGTFQMTVTPKNSCGTYVGTSKLYKLYNPTDCECGRISCGPQQRTSSTTQETIFKIYPNPSSNIVNIDLFDPNNKPANGATISGELFDLMGQSKSRIEIINNKAFFSVQGLKKGVYVLKIYINGIAESHQIGVE